VTASVRDARFSATQLDMIGEPEELITDMRQFMR
jgi:hypothetical protein